jgi:hypothetical protein
MRRYRPVQAPGDLLSRAEPGTLASGLAAYLDWPVTFKDGAIFCENGGACPNPSCDGNGTARIRMVYLLDPRELLEWIKKHAEDPPDA